MGREPKETQQQYWIAYNATTEGTPDLSSPIDSYSEQLDVIIIPVYTNAQDAQAYAQTRVHGGPNSEPLPVAAELDANKFKEFAAEHPEVYVDLDPPPDNPMPEFIDELTPIKKFAATL